MIAVSDRCVQESSVQEEVEMMVESLLDVLLQTLLSIMSKSHSVETSRGQRCPQCTAEITVSKKKIQKKKSFRRTFAVTHNLNLNIFKTLLVGWLCWQHPVLG